MKLDAVYILSEAITDAGLRKMIKDHAAKDFVIVFAQPTANEAYGNKTQRLQGLAETINKGLI